MNSATRHRINAVRYAREFVRTGDVRAHQYLVDRRPDMTPDAAAALILCTEVSRLEKELEESNRQARKDVAALALELDRRGGRIP